ncbi:MAG: hypothetical protein SX243_17745 [Acidobacteriota bacterium]|nr:hypothetical protein [Acidobacteriota bacterium]
MLRYSCLSILLTLFIVTTGCGPGAPSEAPAAEAGTAADSDAPEAEDAVAGEEVQFEPAYPEDVSSEGLSEEDMAQQEAGHSHSEGGDHEGDHSHGEEDHSHGEDEENHDHDDGH